MLDKTAPLTTFVYRSKATQDFDPASLGELVSSAQSRNEREGISGVVAFDSGDFFQWLEGPRQSIERVTSSIQRDERHKDIDVVWTGEQPTRMFSGWSMQLAVRETLADTFDGFAIGAPTALIESLHRSNREIASLLSSISQATLNSDTWSVPTQEGGENSCTEVVSSFVLDSLIPQLYERHVQGLSDTQRLMRDRARYDQDISPLVDKLLSPMAASDEELIEGLKAVGGYLPQGFARLYRRVCANLATRLEKNSITSFDVSLALSVLQVSFHRAAQDRWRQHTTQTHKHRVLVSHFPGDPHLMGTSIKSEILDAHGWPVDSLYPDTSTDVVNYVKSRRFDVITLPFSRVLSQKHLVAPMRDLIARIRQSADGKQPAIVVGGRLFAANPEYAETVDADAICWAIDDIEESVFRAIENRAAKQ